MNFDEDECTWNTIPAQSDQSTHNESMSLSPTVNAAVEEGSEAATGLTPTGLARLSHFAPTNPSPLSLSQINNEPFSDEHPNPTNVSSPLGRWSGAAAPTINTQRPAQCSNSPTEETSCTTPTRDMPRLRAMRHFSPGVWNNDIPSGGRLLLRYTMGFREDRDVCSNPNM